MEDHFYYKINHEIVQELIIENLKLNLPLKYGIFYWRNTRKRNNK